MHTPKKLQIYGYAVYMITFITVRDKKIIKCVIWCPLNILISVLLIVHILVHVLFFLIVYYDEEDVECNSPSEFFNSLWKCMTSCEWKAVCQDRSNLVALSINM